jgi:manganese transport protein
MSFKSNHTDYKSLAEVHESVDVSNRKNIWKKVIAYFGPAYLVSVGYMDPGNWATDIEGGSKYGYTLIWVLLMSNVMAFILQSLSARLGLVRGRDLAQASKEAYPPVVNIFLYILAEIAIAACDLAEVLGMAIGLQLLFGLPLIYGVAITILDTFVLLFLQKLGMRKMEIFIISLITIIGMAFFVELMYAGADFKGLAAGFVPSIPDDYALYITIGIIGATVMPHNLYLHSALVQTRKVEKGHKHMKLAIKLNTWDSAIALNLAFFVNAAILVLAASVFHRNALYNVADIRDAHKLLQPLMGTRIAPILFAVALIASGQSSTITGTLAGQVVMEGYLNLRLQMWLRRLITRVIAVLPAFFVILNFGEKSAGGLLVLSQVILSVQLGFAVIPLIHFVSDRSKMAAFTIRSYTKIIAWGIAAVIIAFNMKLVIDKLTEWFAAMPPEKNLVKYGILCVAIFCAVMLGYIIFEPLIRKFRYFGKKKISELQPLPLGDLANGIHHKIAITVDFSNTDILSIRKALMQGGKNAEYVLIHVIESANALLNENEVADMQTGTNLANLREYVDTLNAQGYKASSMVGYGRRAIAIAKLVQQSGADLLVMGAHGHRGFKDLIFGETINSVRHKIKIPLLAVK